MELTQNKKIILPTRKGFIMCNTNDIVHCKAEGRYTKFFLRDNTEIVVSKNLKEWEKALDTLHFIRVHDSHLVNELYIHEYLGGNTGELIMNDNTHIPVSRRRKKAFLDILKTRQNDHL